MFVPLLFLASLFSPAFAAGEVYVSSVVPGARILVDGAETGLFTPDTVKGIVAGAHSITLVDGCARGETTVDVVDDATARVTIPVIAGGGSLMVQVMPAEATVELNGNPITAGPGVPMSVSCGSHTISVQADGHMAAVLTVDVDYGQELVLPITLEELGYGDILLDVRPRNTLLWLDGVQQSRGGQELEAVLAGPHMLRLEAGGHTPIEEIIVLEKDQVMELAFTLERMPRAARRQQVGAKEGVAGRLGGVLLTVGGTGALAYAAYEYNQTAGAYDDYLALVDQVDAGAAPAQYADEHYASDVLPHAQRMQASGIVGSLLLLSGVTLVVSF
jgi:hypothetical protein